MSDLITTQAASGNNIAGQPNSGPKTRIPREERVKATQKNRQLSELKTQNPNKINQLFTRLSRSLMTGGAITCAGLAGVTFLIFGLKGALIFGIPMLLFLQSRSNQSKKIQKDFFYLKKSSQEELKKLYKHPERFTSAPEQITQNLQNLHHNLGQVCIDHESSKSWQNTLLEIRNNLDTVLRRYQNYSDELESSGNNVILPKLELLSDTLNEVLASTSDLVERYSPNSEDNKPSLRSQAEDISRPVYEGLGVTPEAAVI